jgi:hypothetical protein
MGNDKPKLKKYTNALGMKKMRKINTLLNPNNTN